jgi:hypothetical protein
LLRQEKITKKKATPVRRPLRVFPALLNQTGLLINSHDLLRSHVLKHIRRTTPVWSALLGGAQGKERQRRFCVRFAHSYLLLARRAMPASLVLGFGF